MTVPWGRSDLDSITLFSSIGSGGSKRSSEIHRCIMPARWLLGRVTTDLDECSVIAKTGLDWVWSDDAVFLQVGTLLLTLPNLSTNGRESSPHRGVTASFWSRIRSCLGFYGRPTLTRNGAG